MSEEEKKIEVVKEEIKEVVKEEKPTGFYLAEVPTSMTTVIAFEDKQIPAEKLLLEIANHLREQTGFELKE